MKIFTEVHHLGLYMSLQRLCNRLGHVLYHPIGKEWFTEGYWLLAAPYGNHPGTIDQYLGKRGESKNGITLDEFKQLDIDVVIASYAPHIPVYAQLIKRYKPRAKLVHQQGNEWAVDFSIVKNLLASTLPYAIPSNVNAVWYHQEFDTSLYSYTPPQKGKLIRSFVNTLGQQRMFDDDWKDFLTIEKLLPQYTFESYGASCREGIVIGDIMISEKMKGSTYGFHLKTGGDGYGHIIHQWAACGRPLIFRSSQYKNRLASQLLVNLVTGFDLDYFSTTELTNKILFLSDEQYALMCENIRDHFKKNVNFELEAQSIKKFLDQLR